jgi:flavin reductase (DIM6/NTAB) family NADH-FMN oxidoreductase RutF
VSDPAADRPVEPERFRLAMGRWATGVSVVTAHDASGDAGLTVNALLSVALRPPSLLVSLQREADTLPVLRGGGGFGVSVLASEQAELSRRFALAIPSVEKFRGVAVRRGRTGVPLLEGSLASFECRLVSEAPAFDHVLFVGEVVELAEGTDRPPLLFFRGQYADAEGTGRIQLPRRPA